MVALDGDVFALSAPTATLNGRIDGPGTLATSGTAAVGVVTLDGGGTWRNSGAVFESGLLTLGDASATPVSVTNSGVWTLTGNPGPTVAAGGVASFTNTGRLVKLGTNGVSTIGANVISSGTASVIAIAAGRSCG